MVRKRTGTNELTARDRRNIDILASTFEPVSTRPREPAPLESSKGIGRRLAAARHAGSEAGPNHLLKPLNRLRERQRLGSLDEPAWQQLVTELSALLPKGRFVIPVTKPHLGLPIARAFQAIDDLATRGKIRKAGQRLLAHYVHDFDTKMQGALHKVQRSGPPGTVLLSGPDRRPPLPTDANLEAMMCGFNWDAARDLVLEFWHAPRAWRQRLRVCAWRRCQRYYIPRSTSPTCRRSCAASLSRQRNRAT